MQTNKLILFITDDEDLKSQLNELDNQSDYQIVISSSLTHNTEYDLIFCDYPLIPNVVFSETDVIVLFKTFDENKIVSLLNEGVGGYILYPITSKVIDAVIRSALRHQSQNDHNIPDSIPFCDCLFKPFNFSIDLPSGTVHLTPSESGILKKLLMNRGLLCLRRHLLKEIKGNVQEIISRNVDVHIASLRKKMGIYGSKISTVRGVGYTFSENNDIPSQDIDS